MSFIAPLLDQTATRKVLSSYSTTAGDLSRPLYAGAASTFPARVQRTKARRIVAGGREVQVSWRLLTTTELAITDIIWLPGDDTGDDNAARRPVDVSVERAFDGSTVCEVLFA